MGDTVDMLEASTPSSLDDELSVLDVQVQNPSDPVVNSEQAIAALVAKAPSDLTTLDEFHASFQANDEDVQRSETLATESIRIKQRGLICAIEAEALNNLAPGLINPSNPLGLYTEQPSPANVEDTVTSLENAADLLSTRTRTSTKELITALATLLTKQGTAALEEMDQDQLVLSNALTHFIKTHGNVSLDNLRLGTGVGSTEQALAVPVEDIDSDESSTDPIVKYMTQIRQAMGSETNSAVFAEIVSACPYMFLNERLYHVPTLAKGDGLGAQPGAATRPALPRLIRLSGMVAAAGQTRNQQYFRTVAGAMLGLSKHLYMLSEQIDGTGEVTIKISMSALSSLAYEIAGVSRRLKEHTDMIHTYITLTADLYAALCGVTRTVAEVPTIGLERFLQSGKGRSARSHFLR